jgi:hypothetical protein
MFRYIEKVAKDDAKYARAMTVLGVLFSAAALLGIIIVIRA